MKPFIIVNVWLLTFEPILLLQVHRTICIFLSLCAPDCSLNYVSVGWACFVKIVLSPLTTFFKAFF